HRPDAAGAADDLRSPERTRHSARPYPEGARERDPGRRARLRVESIRGIDPRDRLPGPCGARRDGAGEPRPPCARRPDKLGDPSPGETAAQRLVQEGEAGREAGDRLGAEASEADVPGAAESI